MAITLTQLRSFLAVVRTGSVTDAADELYVTQPSVSAALSALSKEVGVELTERVGRNIRPSAAGAAFAPYAADVIGLLDEGARVAGEAAGAAQLELRIAAVTTAAEYVVPPLMRAFSELHPELSLTVDVGNREHVFNKVASHETDVAIGGRPPPDGRLVGEPFLPNPILLITAPDDPLARRRPVSVGDLEERAWLLREPGSGTRTMTEEFLARHDVHPRVLTLGSNGAIKRAAAAGLGVSLQSASAAALELELGVVATIPVREDLPSRQWFALRPATGPRREPVTQFLEFVAGEAAREALARAAPEASLAVSD
jgi:DNA-binding transcriptional LysR family regulator